MFGLTLHTAPTEEPITLAEAKRQVNVSTDLDYHDQLLKGLITAARLYCERQTRRQFVTATWNFTFDAFPGNGTSPIYLPRPPLASVTSITYLDTSNQSQTWSSALYRVGTATEPGRIAPIDGETYPDTYPAIGAVTVRYVAGYGAAAAVPMPLKQAMLLLIGHWFANREAVGNAGKTVEMAVESLLGSYSTGDAFTCYEPGSLATSST